MANLYNPAALVFVSSPMISASKALYSFDKRTVEGGFVPSSAFGGEEDAVNAKVLEHKTDLSLPSTLALITPFGPRLYKGGPKRHSLGIAILVPNQDSYRYKAKWKGTEEGISGETRDAETYSLGESYKQVWTGLSYAFRFHEKFGLGASVYLTQNSYSRRYFQSRFGDVAADECPLIGSNRCGFMEFRESELDIKVIGLLFRLGAMWAPHENWRFGLVGSAPSIKLGNLGLFKTSGELDQTLGITRLHGDNTTDNTEYYTDKYKLDVYGIEPANFRFSGAFLWDEYFTIDLDVSVHLPITYKRIRNDPVTKRRYPDGEDQDPDPNASHEWFDYGIVREIERRPVVNFNIGWEVVVADDWTIRNGLFTDFSSAPPVRASFEPQLWHINRYGATLSGGWRSKGYDISVGVMGTYGRGTASIFDDRQQDNYAWQPAPLEEKALYIFIAGVQKAAVKGAKRLYKEAREGTLFEKDGEEEGAEEGAVDGAEDGETAEAETATENAEGAEPEESE